MLGRWNHKFGNLNKAHAVHRFPPCTERHVSRRLNGVSEGAHHPLLSHGLDGGLVARRCGMFVECLGGSAGDSGVKTR